MKKQILLICLIALGMQAFATRIVIIERTKKQCFPGCGEVNDVKIPTILPDGTWVWGRHIQCKGYGFMGCPGVIYTTGENDLPPFDMAAGNSMLDNAINQINLGNPNGVINQQILNTTTNVLYLFTATWTTTLDENQENIEVITITREEVI